MGCSSRGLRLRRLKGWWGGREMFTGRGPSLGRLATYAVSSFSISTVPYGALSSLRTMSLECPCAIAPAYPRAHRHDATVVWR